MEPSIQKTKQKKIWYLISDTLCPSNDKGASWTYGNGFFL